MFAFLLTRSLFFGTKVLDLVECNSSKTVNAHIRREFWFNLFLRFFNLAKIKYTTETVY